MKFLSSFFKSPRTWGLAGTAIVLYFLVFGLFGKTDMSWIMPDTTRMAQNLMFSWPHMPFFSVQKAPANDGGGQYVYYTVPTRQLTPKELAQMGLTNAAPHPTAPAASR